jgi:hypothetical protein
MRCAPFAKNAKSAAPVRSKSNQIRIEGWATRLCEITSDDPRYEIRRGVSEYRGTTLNLLGPYGALLLFPLLSFFIGDPSVFRWGVEHGGRTPMPPDLEGAALRNGRLFLLARYLLLSAYVLTSLDQPSLRKVALGITSLSAPKNIATGVALGIALVLCRDFGRKFWKELDWRTPRNPMRTGSILSWLAIIFVGGVSEELWRAFAIIELRKNGLTFFAGVVLTTLCFGLGQLGGKPSRISGIPAEVHFTFFVGFVIGSIFVMSRVVVIGMCANIVYYLSVLYLVQKNPPIQSESATA